MKMIGIGIDEGCDGSCGIITIKKKGKVAMLEKEVLENAAKLNLDGKLMKHFCIRLYVCISLKNEQTKFV